MIRPTFFLKPLTAFLVLLSVLHTPAEAAGLDVTDVRQTPSLEGVWRDWSLYGMQENGQLVCYLSSGLEHASEPVPRRRQAYVLITNRPSEGRRGIVSVDPGYTYEEGSTVLMSIGHKQFHLYAKGGAAWAQDNEDPLIVAAIRSGSTLVVTGRMQDGPATTDTFSLRGFAQALSALDHACPVPGASPPPVHHHHRRTKKR